VELSASHRQVRGLDLTRNWGQHNALLAGIHAAGHELVVTLDDDLQNPPEEIPALLEALSGEIDLVYGRPMTKRNSAMRRIATRGLRWVVTGITFGRIPTYLSGFRAFRAALLDEVGRDQGGTFVLDILLARTAGGTAAVDVRHDARRYGRSNYSLGELGKHAVIELDSLRRLAKRPGRRSPSYAVRRTTDVPAEKTDMAGQGAAR
jgi:glycosyltransferase involved in cell wall biosynthesis